ncbi:hypothetical protein Tco_0664231 [Tanacetum coccineum]
MAPSTESHPDTSAQSPITETHTSPPQITESPTSSTIKETTRQEFEIPQSNFPTQTLVTDEAAFTGVDVIHGGAATIVSSINAGQGVGEEVRTDCQGKPKVGEGFGAGSKVTTADAELNTASTFVLTGSPQRHAYTTADDLTLAEKLIKIRKSAAKAKGKAKMDETDKKTKNGLSASSSSRFKDAEWDDVLARVESDEDFFQQLQAGEKCSEEDLPMKLVELVNQRKKFFAQQRAEAKRNKPMTPA